MNRVWAYIISKELTDNELNQISETGNAFVLGWTAHENKLSGSFEILYQRIILVKVNEDVNGASGCSIDKLTKFIKQTEATFNIELLNRFLVAYKQNNLIEVIHSTKIKELLTQKHITENTIVFNTSVSNEMELMQWEQSLKDT